MTLSEYLKQHDPEEYVYIGGRSNFFVICKAGDAIRQIEAFINDDIVKSIKSQIKYAKKRRKEMAGCIEVAETDEDVKKYTDLLNIARKTYQHSTEALASFTSLLDCEVTEVYRRKIVQPLGDCVIIDLNVAGWFWDQAEYLRSYGKKVKHLGKLVQESERKDEEDG